MSLLIGASLKPRTISEKVSKVAISSSPDLIGSFQVRPRHDKWLLRNPRGLGTRMADPESLYLLKTTIESSKTGKLLIVL